MMVRLRGRIAESIRWSGTKGTTMDKVLRREWIKKGRHSKIQHRTS